MDTLDWVPPVFSTNSFTDISGTGTALVLGDDEVSSAVPIGFTFAYYAEPYTDAYVSSNGFMM